MKLNDILEKMKEGNCDICGKSPIAAWTYSPEYKKNLCKKCLEESIKGDKLDELFRLQKGINDFIIKTKGLSELPHLDKWATAIMHEGGELWSASTNGKGDGKWWKEKPDTKEHQIVELVDILHFFLGACLSLNLTPQELFDAYCKKLDVNYKRQKDGY